MVRLLLVLGSTALLAAIVPAGAVAIVAGTPAERAAYPFFATVGGSTHCGGALVAPDRVLTAAHCRELLDLSRTVRVGPAGELRRVVRIAAHPVYVHAEETQPISLNLLPADLLVLQLATPITDIAPVRVATAADGLTAPGQAVTIIGQGVPFTGQYPRDMIFRSAATAVSTDKACGDILEGPLEDTWSICTVDPRAATPGARPPFATTCNGDSGGPLLAVRDDVTYDLGTVSGGEECGSADGDVFGDAVQGRAFVLGPSPVWEPRAAGRPRLGGHVRVGSRVRCVVDWLDAPKQTVTTFTTETAGGGFGTERPADDDTSYRLRAKDKGRRFGCQVQGYNAGGIVTTKLSRPVRVR